MELGNFINGAIKPAANGNWLSVYEPASGSVYAQCPASDEADVEQAYQAAAAAFEGWANLAVDERSKYLIKIADLIEANATKLVEAESKDSGKPLSLAAKVDIPRAAANMRFFAQAITQFSSEAHSMTNAINYTLRQPLGVVGTISPWNLPLYLFTWKIAPALAAGNTVIAKPSEVTPYTAYLFGKICIEAGLPKGVLNIVQGLGEKVGSAITNHKGIKAISFTGSTRVGGIIAQSAATSFKKVSLEMGGKNPNIIFADCDYDKMLETTLRSSFANQGQICLCGSRILVATNIYDKFKNDFVERTKALVVDHPLKENCDLGAIVSEMHYNKILQCIEIAKQEGGKILCGGDSLNIKGFENGWYIAPTIIEGLTQNCATNQQEIFGPVVTIQPFKNEAEALQLANNSIYGLSATVWTTNLNRAHRFAKNLQAGIVWVNTWMQRDLRTPFGGVKNSGVGREGGLEALRFFTDAKNVCINYDERNK